MASRNKDRPGNALNGAPLFCDFGLSFRSEEKKQWRFELRSQSIKPLASLQYKFPSVGQVRPVVSFGADSSSESCFYSYFIGSN